MNVTPAIGPASQERKLESRILIHAPTGKDARLLSQVLTHARIENAICSTLHEIIGELSIGASALILADEVLSSDFFRPLTRHLQTQPTWSDLPVLILSTRALGSPDIRERYLQLGNVTLLERPLQSVTLLSAVTSAIRARTRQFEMREIDRRKDEFLAMLAHELRNPLAPVSAAAELLKMPNFDKSRVAQTGNVILRQVKHMSSLIDDLLDVSRVSRGLVTLDKVLLDARQVVSSAIEQVQPLIDAQRHHLTIHLAAEPAAVYADQKRLIQIIANLLNNAAKYTPSSGEIILSLEVFFDSVQLTITDNGIGIPDSIITHIFEMFAQGERTPDRSEGGLGIGLALVKSLVVLHGGTVSAESRGLGQGSCFKVTLPRVAQQISIQTDETSNIPALPVSRRLLIVDDNVDAAEMLALFLEAAGYETTVVHTAQAAMSSVRSSIPDACLLDIGLPDMDGTELAAALRLTPGLERILLVAITGYGQVSDSENALNAGFDSHMVKPVNTEKLLTLLSNIPSKTMTN